MEECGSTVDIAAVATELGKAEILAGQPTEAERWARRSLELLGDEPRLETAHSWMILSQAQTLLGHSEEANQTARLSASMLETMGASRKAAKIWRELGDLMNRQGQHESACVAYDRALESMGLAAAPPAPAPGRWSEAAPAVRVSPSLRSCRPRSDNFGLKHADLYFWASVRRTYALVRLEPRRLSSTNLRRACCTSVRRGLGLSGWHFDWLGANPRTAMTLVATTRPSRQTRRDLDMLSSSLIFSSPRIAATVTQSLDRSQEESSQWAESQVNDFCRDWGGAQNGAP